MDDDVKQLLLGFQKQIELLTDQNRALTDLVAKMGGNAPALAGTTMTFTELYVLWAPTKKRSKSWIVIEARMRPAVVFFGKRVVTSLRPADWEAYRAERRATPIKEDNPDRTYGALTVNFELGWIKAMMNWGYRVGHISHHPFSGVKPEKTKRQRDTSPIESELGRFLEIADPIRRVMILCAADSGMRRNEICQLRWDWIDEQARTIKLPGWATKNGKPRTVPMNARTWDAISAIPRHLRCPNVLVNPDTEQPFKRGTLTKWFKDISIDSGVEGAPGDGRVRLHDLRHSFASQASRRGVRLDLVSKFLGHATIQQTLVYVQLSDDDVAPAIDKLESGLAKDLEKVKEQKRRGAERATDGESTIANTREAKRNEGK